MLEPKLILRDKDDISCLTDEEIGSIDYDSNPLWMANIRGYEMGNNPLDVVIKLQYKENRPYDPDYNANIFISNSSKPVVGRRSPGVDHARYIGLRLFYAEEYQNYLYLMNRLPEEHRKEVFRIFMEMSGIANLKGIMPCLHDYITQDGLVNVTANKGRPCLINVYRAYQIPTISCGDSRRLHGSFGSRNR